MLSGAMILSDAAPGFFDIDPGKLTLSNYLTIIGSLFSFLLVVFSIGFGYFFKSSKEKREEKNKLEETAQKELDDLLDEVDKGLELRKLFLALDADDMAHFDAKKMLAEFDYEWEATREHRVTLMKYRERNRRVSS